MATENKPAVTLSIFLLIRIDVEKTYKICLGMSNNKDTAFQGIYDSPFPF